MSDDAGMGTGTYLSIAAIGIAGVGTVYNNMEIRKLQGNMNEQGAILHGMIKKVTELNTLNRGVESVSSNVRELKQLVDNLSQNHQESNQMMEQILRKLAMQDHILQEYSRSMQSLIKAVSKSNPEANIYVPQPPSRNNHQGYVSQGSRNSSGSQAKPNRQHQQSHSPKRSQNSHKSTRTPKPNLSHKSGSRGSRESQSQGVQFANEDDLLA